AACAGTSSASTCRSSSCGPPVGWRAARSTTPSSPPSPAGCAATTSTTAPASPRCGSRRRSTSASPRTRSRGTGSRSWPSPRRRPPVGWSQAVAGALNLLPVPVTAGMLRHVDLLASTVPGFSKPVYVGGARVDAFYAFGPTVGSAANLTLMSYRQTCHLGITTDQGAVPDPAVFLDCVRAGFEEVLALAERATRPG